MGSVARDAERTCGRKKKLIEAARHWARGGRREDERRTHEEEKRALLEAGATEQEAELALKAREPTGEAESVEIWPEHLEALELFCALETQWHVAAGFAAVRTGLIYSEATNLMRERGLGRKRRIEVLEQLRVMERAALDAWNEGED